ncbi:MAG: tetratricopeptide repeat protein [Bacteroidia bacterium]
MKGKFSKKQILIATCFLAAGLSFGQDLKQAIQLTKDEQFEKADKAFKSLINAKPGDGENYFYEGENFFSWGKLDSAQAAYEKGIKMNPLGALNYAGLGKIKLYQGNTQDANDNFYKAKTYSKSRDAIVLSKIAEAYTGAPAQFRDLKQAIDLLNQAIQLDSKNPDLYIDLGDAQWATDPTNASNAISQYEKALHLNPKNVIAILREGMIYQNAANYDLSYQYYQKANQVDSTFAPAYRQKAEMLCASQRYDDAISQYKKYLALNDALSARIRYAKFLFLAKKYGDAISEIQKILAKDSSDIFLYRVLAYSQYETKDYKSGLTNINKFFTKAGKSGTKLVASDYKYYGNLLSKNGQDSLAIIKMSQAATMLVSSGAANDASDIYFQIGSICYLGNKCNDAITYFQKQLKISQSDYRSYYYLGRSAYDCKQYLKADTAFSNVIRMMPNFLQGYQWRAYADQANDSANTGSATPMFDAYLQKIGTDTMKNKEGIVIARSYYANCEYVKGAGGLEKAKYWWHKVQDIDPANEYAKKFFDAIKKQQQQPKKPGSK